MGNSIENSKVDNTAKLYNGIRMSGCEIAQLCRIGDDCDLVNTKLSAHAELGRRNLIRNTFLGCGSYTGTNTIIKNTTIGNYSSIAWNVSIGGGRHNYCHTSMYTDYWFDRTFDIGLHTPPELHCVKTAIGSDVWIGAGANIVGGVTIGDGCVIGAGAVITKDVEPYSIVVGVPGRIIKKRFPNDVVERLKKIKWWAWSEDTIRENVNLLRTDISNEVLSEMEKISAECMIHR